MDLPIQIMKLQLASSHKFIILLTDIELLGHNLLPPPKKKKNKVDNFL